MVSTACQGTYLHAILVIFTASMKFSRKFSSDPGNSTQFKANNNSRRTFNMLFANAARGKSSSPAYESLDLSRSFVADPAILLPHDMNPKTPRGLCSTLPQSFTPQQQPGHAQHTPHSGCQLIMNCSNFHVGRHFLCNAGFHRSDLPIGWSVLVDPALLPQDFPRTQTS